MNINYIILKTMEHAVKVLKTSKKNVTNLFNYTDSSLLASDSSSSKPENNKRFDFLDGYRGSLALVVVVIHSRIHLKCELLNLLKGYSQSYSIAGFFMLSAFLLTYRLLKDFTKADRNPKQYLLHILNYIIRRFIRIYIYYVLFYAAAKYGPDWVGGLGSYRFGQKMSHIMLLGSTGRNHLWTIPAEIKYYAVIPIYCMVACLLGRFSPLLSLFSLLWTILDQYYNIFHLKTKDTAVHTPNTFNLKSHFAVFFLGSQVALAYYLIERNEFLVRIFKVKFIQISLNYISLAIALIGLKQNEDVFYDTFAFKSKATLYWSSCLLLTLVSRPNIISRFFASSEFLKKLGKYSYTLYMMHFGVLSIVKKFNIKHQLEHIIICVFASYCVSYVFFHLIEVRLIKFANYLCNKLNSMPFFKNNSKPIDDVELPLNLN